MGRVKVVFGILLCLSILSCKEAFVPDLGRSDSNYLIVEGFINTGADSTIFKLSRTTPLQDSVQGKLVTGATVIVESDGNQVYTLQEKANGTYFSANLNLNPANKHRIRIRTGSAEYLSDFVESKASPPISDLNFRIEDDKVKIYASTRDPSDKSRYYKWNYDETWEIRSDFESFWKWNGTAVVKR